MIVSKESLEKITNILPHYTLGRPLISKISGGYLYVSNSHWMIKIPIKCLGLSLDEFIKSNSFIGSWTDSLKYEPESFFDQSTDDIPRIINTLDLTKLIGKMPKIIKEIKTEIDCPKCFGCGEISFQYNEGKYPCTYCDGTGKVIGPDSFLSIVPETPYIVKSGDSFFKGEYIDFIYQICLILKATKLYHLAQNDKGKNLFQIENLEFILMPIIYDFERNEEHKLLVLFAKHEQLKTQL